MDVSQAHTSQRICSPCFIPFFFATRTGTSQVLPCISVSSESFFSRMILSPYEKHFVFQHIPSHCIQGQMPTNLWQVWPCSHAPAGSPLRTYSLVE